MRILSLTARAASMYCGSCLRDNALAARLIKLGHDVTLLPFYTPTLTDEDNVSRPVTNAYNCSGVAFDAREAFRNSNR